MDADQFATLVTLLTEIRDAVVWQPEEEGVEAPACDHPDDRRLDFSTTRETHWTCQDCGHVEQHRPIHVKE